MKYEFTSESVSEGHPDKIADLISDTIATALINGKRHNRAAIETLVTTNLVVVAGEYKTDVKVTDEFITELVRKVILSIGYEQRGFHWANVTVVNKLHGQSADIALGTDIFGAGDQGIMFGYACNHTPQMLPITLVMSHAIVERLAYLRRNYSLFSWLEPDAKAQVTFEFDEHGNPLRASKVVCSTQHEEIVPIEAVRSSVKSVCVDVLGKWGDANTEYFINPTGRFVIGGPDGDTGLTGRKIIVDTYGGAAPHGGGAFSGKDFTKVDRSAAYMARYIAKNVASYLKCNECLVQLSYAIGVAEPTSVLILVDGKHNVEMEQYVRKHVDLTPMGILERFDMPSLDLTTTTNYGHFGREDLPWERVELFRYI